MSYSFYERVLLSIRERETFYQDRILTGNLTFDEYKSMTGRLLGLQESEEAVKDAYKFMFEDTIKKEGN